MKTLFAIALATFALLGLTTRPALADSYSHCERCGTVKNIESYQEKRSSTGGAIVGGLVGGLVGNQIGGGDGKKVATVAGVVGGAYAGKKIAENNDKNMYDVTVKMDNGETRVLTQSSTKNMRVGSRVTVKNNKAKLRY
jgi:outer membrane lipoprotein SlyB